MQRFGEDDTGTAAFVLEGNPGRLGFIDFFFNFHRFYVIQTKEKGGGDVVPNIHNDDDLCLTALPAHAQLGELLKGLGSDSERAQRGEDRSGLKEALKIARGTRST